MKSERKESTEKRKYEIREEINYKMMRKRENKYLEEKLYCRTKEI